jgi:hypothetical protein
MFMVICKGFQYKQKLKQKLVICPQMPLHSIVIVKKANIMVTVPFTSKLQDKDKKRHNAMKPCFQQPSIDIWVESRVASW